MSGPVPSSCHESPCVLTPGESGLGSGEGLGLEPELGLPPCPHFLFGEMGTVVPTPQTWHSKNSLRADFLSSPSSLPSAPRPFLSPGK